MLFGPRTEYNTYSALAPAIAVLCAQAWLVDRRRLAAVGLAIVALLILGSFEIGRRLAPGVLLIWLAPLMCVWFTSFVVVRVLQARNDPSAAGVFAAREPT
jgi:hypothetical protein